MLETLNTIFNSIFYIIAPPFCRFCDNWLQKRDIFCDLCSEEIQPVVSDFIQVKKYNIPILSASSYENPIKKLVVSKLWSDRTSALQLGELIWQKTVISNLEFDYIVPIPLHWTRYLKRGYNQAEVIAKVLSKKSNKPVLNILKRSKRTLFQSFLSKQDRLKNVENVFSLNKKIDLADRKILIVDDLLTTGATIKAASLELIKLSPENIKVVVACRAI